MRPITYRHLKAALEELTDEQLDMSVLVLNENEELLPITDNFLACEVEELEDVVEADQPLLKLEN
jgi:hypothetical protein